MYRTLADQRQFGAKVVTALNWLLPLVVGGAAFAIGEPWLQLAIAGLIVAGASIREDWRGGSALRSRSWRRYHCSLPRCGGMRGKSTCT